MVGCVVAIATWATWGEERRADRVALAITIGVAFWYSVVGLASHIVRLLFWEGVRRGYLRPFGFDDFFLCLKERPAAQRIMAVLAVALILRAGEVDPKHVALLIVTELLFELVWWFIRSRIARSVKRREEENGGQTEG